MESRSPSCDSRHAYPALLRLTLRCLTCHGGMGVLLGCYFYFFGFFFFWSTLFFLVLYCVLEQRASYYACYLFPSCRGLFFFLHAWRLVLCVKITNKLHPTVRGVGSMLINPFCSSQTKCAENKPPSYVRVP